MELLIQHGKPVLFTGPTGTGKSVNIRNFLSKMDPMKYSSLFMNLSYQTGANQVQDMIDSKLVRRGHDQFGPILGRSLVVFVDDLNMPATDQFGAQPPIELLRQFMDHQGWYDRKSNTFKQLLDMRFVAAMQGKRNSKATIQGNDIFIASFPFPVFSSSFNFPFCLLFCSGQSFRFFALLAPL